MRGPSDGVFTKLLQACREIFTGTALFLVPVSLWLTLQSLLSPGKPWLWVAYSGWAAGFLGIWIAWAQAGKKARHFAADALPAVAAVGITLLGVFASDAELAGPLLSGLAIVGAGVWLLRRATNQSHAADARAMHDELVQQQSEILVLLRTIEERSRPAGPSRKDEPSSAGWPERTSRSER